MDKLREALIEACNVMDQKARSMKMHGVAVASVLSKDSEVDWIGEMKVVPMANRHTTNTLSPSAEDFPKTTFLLPSAASNA